MRYLRANTPAQARCPSCGDFVLFLRWGHESRCARFRGAGRPWTVRTGAALLLVLALALFATPAYAMELDPSKLADDLNTKALATICVLLVLSVAFLSKALMTSYEKRIERGEQALSQILETHSNVVKLGLQTTDAVKVLGEAVEHVTRRDP